TAHATEEEAEEEARNILEIYRTFAEEYMAMPVIPGYKTEKEKFAGAVRTYTIEAMMQDRRALQAGTSHNLGQNFARAFDVTYQDENGEQQYVWATSWGVSTRLIGALIMTHSDDQGLVLPPRLAPLQVVVVPIWRGDEEMERLKEAARKLTRGWEGVVTFKIDDRENYRPGWKFNEWETRGVPIRVELGPRDLENNQAVLVRRDTGEKISVSQEGILEEIQNLLEDIQRNLFERARRYRDEHTFVVDDYDEFKQKIEEPGGFFKIHWCGSRECEDRLQEETKATIRCIPFDQEKEEGRCLLCGKPSHGRVIAAKAY
ncbi:MAG TPA: proline--tRNA ligase, partial [Bacteroidetes bacterium]|nr:proline--tRNA ligase [Bacteroidota bacterium]